MREMVKDFSNSRRVLLFYANREKQPWPIMPIGMCYVASTLAKRGHTVKAVDLMFKKDWRKAACWAVEQFEPEVIGISVRNMDNADWSMSKNYLPVVRDELVTPLRNVSSALIMIGGPAVNIAPQQIVDFVNADCAVYGDGECRCSELVEKWKADKQLPTAEGVIWNSRLAGKTPKAIPIGQSPCRLETLEGNVTPRVFEWIDVAGYCRLGTPYPIQTKRGCSFGCSFCVYGQIEGRKYRQRDPEDVAAEIENVHRKSGIRQFEFTDSVFNHPPGHAEELCRAIAERKLAKVCLSSSGVNPAFVTAELLRLMERAGFEDYSFAPDSASPAVLRDLGKGYSSQEVLVRAAETAKTSYLPVIWWFSFGMPGEDSKSIQETLDFIRSYLRPRDLALCTMGIRIYPGTRLAQIAEQEGQIGPNQDLLQPVFYQPPAMPLAEMQRMLRDAARQIPSMVFTSDLGFIGKYLKFGIAVKRILHHRQPVWRPVPYVNRALYAIGKAVYHGDRASSAWF